MADTLEDKAAAEAKAREIIEPMIPFMALAPRQFSETADMLSDTVSMKITDQLDAIIFYLVRLSTYLTYRRYYNGDDSHDESRKESNKRTNKVRRLMGYQDDINLSY